MLGHRLVGKPASLHDGAKDKEETCGYDSAAVFSGKTLTDLNERSSAALGWPQLQGQQLLFTSPDPKHIDKDRGQGGVATVGTRNVKTNRWGHIVGTDTSIGFFWSLIVSFQAMLACEMVTELSRQILSFSGRAYKLLMSNISHQKEALRGYRCDVKPRN